MFFPRKVVIGSFNYPKLCQVPEEDGPTPKSIDGGLIELLAKSLKFEYVVKMPVDKALGNPLPGGNSTGLIGMVERGEADMAICFISVHEERAKVIDYSHTYYYDDITFATHLPKFLPRFTIYALPFQLSTWIYILLTVVSLTLILFALSGFKTSPVKLFLELYANVLNQSCGNSRWNHLVLQGCWWIFVTVVSFSYKAVIQSFLTIPIYSDPLRDFKELSDVIVKGEYRGTGPQSSMRNFLLENSQKHLADMAKVMENNNGFVPIAEYGKDGEIEEKTALLGLRIMLYFRFGKPPLSTVYVPTTVELPYRIAVAVNKEFCCMDSLNKALAYIMRAGLYNKLVNDEDFRTWMKATKTFENGDPQRALTLEDISGALGILTAGIFIAAFVLMIEIYVNKKQGTCHKTYKTK